MYNLPVVPNDFDVPELLETERLRLRPLTIQDAVRDYDAVMTSESVYAAFMIPVVTGPRD